MIKRIDKDVSRFRKIVRGKVKKNLKKYITKGELIGKKGNDFVSIPIDQINIPRFRFSSKKSGGVGQGEGAVGTPIGKGDPQDGAGNAGDSPGRHILEVDVPLDELAEMLGEELELPNIEPKGKKNISSKKDKYTGISDTGPESLKHFKRTYKRALKRQIMSQAYNPNNPIIVPIKEDKRYRTWKTTVEPESNAVIIYMMDVSGSMGDEQKEIVRTQSFWIDTWLHHQYKNIETRYIIHDAIARMPLPGRWINKPFITLGKVAVQSFLPPTNWRRRLFKNVIIRWSGTFIFSTFPMAITGAKSIQRNA